MSLVSHAKPPLYRSARHFARVMLEDDRVPMAPTRFHWFTTDVGEAVLYREDRWQIEMVVARPHAQIPRHRHDHVDSYEVALAGSVNIVIGHRAYVIAAENQRGALAAQILHVPRGEWHEGRALEQGSIYLSFQEWDEGRGPGLITTDWTPWTAH